jgi:hypothetical protein
MTGSGGQGQGGTSSAGASGTNNAGTSGSGGGGYSECAETPSEIRSDQTTTLGFSAEDVLAGVGGLHATDLAWVSSALYATHARAGTITSLELDFSATPSAVRFVDSQGGGCIGVDGPCLICEQRVEIDIDLSAATGDGSLDEQLTVTLKAKSVSAPEFSIDVPMADMIGAYLDEVVSDGTYPLWGFRLEGGFGTKGWMSTVPNAWNGFTAALLESGGPFGTVMQAHGYYPKETAGL